MQVVAQLPSFEDGGENPEDFHTNHTSIFPISRHNSLVLAPKIAFSGRMECL